MFPAHFIHTPLEECSFRLWINIPMLNNSATARSPAVTARPVKTPVGVFVGFFYIYKYCSTWQITETIIQIFVESGRKVCGK